MFRIITIFCLPLICFVGVSVAQTQLAKKIDAVFANYMKVGLAGTLLVAEKGRPTLKKAYGFANNEAKAHNRPETLFNVASVGKQFTVFSVLLLEKKGLLNTDDLVSRYIAEFAGSKATMHHLLTHTSGLFRQSAQLEYSTRPIFIESVIKAGPESAPGEKYRYSNAGYSLLAAIVEICSGKAFETFIAENIFGPFKMRDTGYPWEPRLKGKPMATGYNKEHKPVPVQENIWAARGPGNIVTNVLDLFKWMRAFQNPTLVHADVRDKMLFDYRPGEDTYAWNKATTKHGTKFFHKGGGRSDFETRLMWYPDDKVLVIFALNNDYDLAGKLFSDISDIIN